MENNIIFYFYLTNSHHITRSGSQGVTDQTINSMSGY